MCIRDRKKAPEWVKDQETISTPSLLAEEENRFVDKSFRPTNQLQETIATTASEIYLHNAGLILLAPAIAPLFDKLGYIQKGQFKNNVVQTRAIHVLQYMVGRESQPAEFLLPLNKIICGLSIKEPIERTIELTEIEKKETLVFIESMIHHWSVLKTTSAQGLQDAFLQRKGKLVFKEDQCWHLKVEHKTLDILLNKLPWGFAIIKHPWMTHMLKTEWVY